MGIGILLFFLAPSAVESRLYAIQSGSYKLRENAVNEMERLNKLGQDTFYKYEHIPGKGDLYRLYIGRFASRDIAHRKATELLNRRLIPECFIRSISEEAKGKPVSHNKTLKNPVADSLYIAEMVSQSHGSDAFSQPDYHMGLFAFKDDDHKNSNQNTEKPPGTEPSTQDHFNLGKQYFDAGRYDEAYDQFFKAFSKSPGDPKTDFYLGRAAFEKGDYEAAVMAFERVLIVQPDAMRIKLEMARCFFHLKAYETAKQYFNEVLAAKPPEMVQKNIENFLAAMEAAETRHLFNGLVSFGITWDDNARVSPAEDKINTVIGDITLVGPSATPQNDRIFTTTALINHVYKFSNDRLFWKTSGLNYNGFYQYEDDLDLNFLNIVSGPQLQSGKFLFELQGLFNQLYLEHDRYLGILGMGSIITFAPTPNYVFNISAKGEQKEFFQDGSKDALNLGLNGNSFFIFAPNRVAFGVGGESENAESDINSYSRYKVSLRYDRLIPYDINMFTGFRFQKTSYNESEALFGKKRTDDLKEFTAGVSKALWRSSDNRRILSVYLNYTYTKSDSNIDLYTYKKNVVATSFEFRF